MDKIYKFSSSTVSINDFFKRFAVKKKLPQVCHVVEGFQGAEDVNSFSSGETILIVGVQHQSRVILKNHENNFLSFSLRYGREFCVLPKSKSGQQSQILGPYTLKDITTEYQSISGLKIKLIQGGEKGVQTDNRHLIFTVIKLCTEPLLVGYSINVSGNEEEVGDNAIPLSLYIPIKVVVAEGLVNGSKDGLAAKLKALAVGKHAKAIRWTANNEGVLMYGEGVSESTDYESLRPRALIYNLGYQQVTKALLPEDGLYAEVHADPEKIKALPTTSGGLYATIDSGHAVDNATYLESGAKKVDTSPEVSKQKMPRNSLQKKVPPKVPRKPVSMAKGVSVNLYVGIKQSRPLPDAPDEETAVPGKSDVQSETTDAKQTQETDIRREDDENPAKQNILSSAEEKAESVLLLPIKADVTDELNKTGSQVNIPRTSSEDIPESLSGMSTEAVTSFLHDWKLSHHAQALADQQVDGDLLLALTEKDLIEHFAFTSFEAKKLVLFAKNPRRPKKHSEETHI